MKIYKSNLIQHIIIVVQTNSITTNFGKYRYIRRNINGNRGNISETQVSEFEICNSSGTKMSRPSGTTITCNYTYSDMQTYGPQKLIDGSVNTKRYVAYQTGIIITIDLHTSINRNTYNKYKRYTANDMANRDPKTRTLQISKDGTNRKTVSTISNASITTSRNTLAGTRDFT